MIRLLAQQNVIMTDHTTILAQVNNNLAAVADALQNMTDEQKTELLEMIDPNLTFQIYFSVAIANKRKPIYWFRWQNTSSKSYLMIE